MDHPHLRKRWPSTFIGELWSESVSSINPLYLSSVLIKSSYSTSKGELPVYDTAGSRMDGQEARESGIRLDKKVSSIGIFHIE